MSQENGYDPLESGRRRRPDALIIIALLALLALGALAIGLAALIKHGLSIDTLNGEVFVLQGNVTTLDERVTPLEEEVVVLTQNASDLAGRVTVLEEELVNVTTRLTVVEASLPPAAMPAHGWLAFWWQDEYSGLKHSWARFNETTGLMIGSPIPYTPSEARQSSPPGKSQFSNGPAPYDMSYLVFSFLALSRYLVRHNTLAGTYQRTDLGATPVSHGLPELVVYDPVNTRYLVACTVTPATSAYGLVVLDETTGALTPLTGVGGTFPPNNNQALDLEVIGGYVLLFDRWDDDARKGHIIFYNSTTGQYVSESFFNGTVVAYPGTFVPSIHQYVPNFGNAVLWYTAAGYNPSAFRLNLVLMPVPGGGYERELGWIEGTSEEDLLSKLLSGNYDINLTQHQTPFMLNGGVYISDS